MMARIQAAEINKRKSVDSETEGFRPYNAHNVRKLGLSARMLIEVLEESEKKNVDTRELREIFGKLEALVYKVGGRIKR